MLSTKASASGRCVVLDQLHLDRSVFEVLARWAKYREFGIQDAIQVALCGVSEGTIDRHIACQYAASSSLVPNGPIRHPTFLRLRSRFGRA